MSAQPAENRIVIFMLECSFTLNRLGGVMVSVLASCAEGSGIDPWQGQTKDTTIVSTSKN